MYRRRSRVKLSSALTNSNCIFVFCGNHECCVLLRPSSKASAHDAILSLTDWIFKTNTSVWGFKSLIYQVVFSLFDTQNINRLTNLCYVQLFRNSYLDNLCLWIDWLIVTRSRGLPIYALPNSFLDSLVERCFSRIFFAFKFLIYQHLQMQIPTDCT